MTSSFSVSQLVIQLTGVASRYSFVLFPCALGGVPRVSRPLYAQEEEER